MEILLWKLIKKTIKLDVGLDLVNVDLEDMELVVESYNEKYNCELYITP